MVEEVVHRQSLVAKEGVFGHAPMYGVGVAQYVNRIVLLYLEQHLKALGRYGGEVTFPRCDDSLIAQAVGHASALLTERTYAVAKLMFRNASLFQLGEDTGLFIGAKIGTYVETYLIERTFYALTVEVDQHATKVK